ncbi:transglutaminase domain-containing protein [Paraliomyxa miuraensis]|uniref:transglutaminase domain-containing protein n=1 Tax=Paraliomyxa miuraensis TaxID=376150 RepID=UPI00224CF098|nr:transglutaminase domain-containing protein [Paraliomyxa miuraensis]MCX4246284.1 ATP-binding protein [Paraliomyxa miuraensis]
MAEGPGQAGADKSRAFRERARLEADRYGPDPWIFVRELLQNSRDAGANTVSFTVGERPADGNEPDGSRSDDGSGKQVVEWVSCQDDGEGMTFEHARRYLFALYASSKEDRKNQAGKFGVGFWSILRFDPKSIIIRSRPRHGEPWAVRLDGSLEHAEHVEPPQHPGTEIRLERPRGDGRLEHRIYDAVWQSARYLYRRDAPEQPLPITINGRSANAEFGLEAPSASFRRRSVRGVVGLGRAPRVELFCRGLRVRSAACLEDLVAPAGRHTARIRVQFPELPAGLAPQALLESDALEVMLSRSDARDGRALARLVKLAQRELERLVEHQLAFARPSPWYRRAYDRMRSRLRESLAWRTFVGSAVGAIAAVVLSLWLWGDVQVDGASETDAGAPIAVTGPPSRAVADETYQDLGRRYRGPRVDVLAEGSAEPVKLHYEPQEVRLHFAALAFTRLRDDGAPDHEVEARVAGDYRGAECPRDCVEVSLPIRGRGAVRLPVPTGHRVVSGSLRLDGRPVALGATSEGHPVIDLGEDGAGQLRYQTTPAVDPEPAPKTETVERMPSTLAQQARNLRHLAVNERVGHLLAFVRARVEYDRSEEMARRHNEAMARGQSFIERTLELGKGDCDVQNGLLVALLQAADVPARLAVGYLGVDGKVLPWLHAWVEYRDEGGIWHIADASERSVVQVAAAGPPSSPGQTPGVTVGESTAGVSQGPGEPPPQGVGVTAAPREPAPEPSPEPADSPPAVSTTVAPPAHDATPSASDGSGRATWLAERLGWVWPGLALVLLVGASITLAGGRTRRAFKLDHSADLSRLLQGALQQPGAFGAMSALLYRPLVPLVSDSAISLQRARELAAKGRLYRTHERSALAMRASRAGSVVLDTQSPEGQTVADALGAIDLDRWDARLGGSKTTPLLDEVNRTLRRRREGWSLRAATEVSGRIAALDLDTLRVRMPGVHGSRVVLIDATCSWLLEAEARHAHAPRTAVFAVLDHVADQLDLPEDRRAALLSEGARAALLESFPVPPGGGS